MSFKKSKCPKNSLITLQKKKESNENKHNKKSQSSCFILLIKFSSLLQTKTETKKEFYIFVYYVVKEFLLYFQMNVLVSVYLLH